jgi:hypothetical protein
LLEWEVLRCNEAGEPNGAASACRAALNAGRSLGDEPTLISQLVRTASVIKACLLVERTLAQGEVRSEDLQALQAAFADEVGHPDLLIGARGERAMINELYDVLERGDLHLSEAIGEGTRRPTWSEKLLGWRYRNLIRADHPTYLAFMTRYVEEAQLPPDIQEAAEQQWVADARNLPTEAILTRLMVPAIAKVGESSRRKQSHLRSLVAALAVERYRQARGAWPTALDVLVPDFLDEVSGDPYDGKPLRYRRLADGAVVYSVNRDRSDDGGNFDRSNEILPHTDIGFRLWDVKHRRQPLRP